MSYVIDRITDRACVPAFLRAAHMIENCITIEHSLKKFSGDKRRMLEEQMHAAWDQVDRLIAGMTRDNDDFEATMVDAYTFAERIADERQILALEKIERREREAEQRAERLRQLAYEEQLINSGIMA